MLVCWSDDTINLQRGGQGSNRSETFISQRERVEAKRTEGLPSLQSQRAPNHANGCVRRVRRVDAVVQIDGPSNRSTSALESDSPMP